MSFIYGFVLVFVSISKSRYSLEFDSPKYPSKQQNKE